MVEFSKDSTNIKPKKENANISVKEDKTLSLTSSFSCDLGLDRERLKAILENIPSAVLVIEKPDGKVIYANKRAIELLGVNPCGLELENHAVHLKILTLNDRVCPT